MGFVGQQIAAANHFLRFGFETQERSIVLKGEAIIDFWTKHSLTDVGLPKTWFDVNPNRWREYQTYLRIACDGAVGVLSGWKRCDAMDAINPNGVSTANDLPELACCNSEC